MSRQYRRFDDDETAGAGHSRVGLGLGAIIVGAALGVGIGLLAAPEAGTRTRRRLRQRIYALGSDLGEGLEGVQHLGGRARKRVRSRLEQLRAREAELLDELRGEDEEEDATSVLGTILSVGASIAATYFLSSERAAPARARAREAAVDFRRRAGDRWERFQHERSEANGQPLGARDPQGDAGEGTRPSGDASRTS